MTQIKLTEEQLQKQVYELTKAVIKLQDQITELKKQLPMTITEAPFEADENKSASDYTNDKPKVEYTTEGAPVWEVWFKVNTSEGITERIVEINAWSEKQAVYLGRTEKLFHDMSKMVKIKQIQPKWNILDAVATKKD
jgi:hypothetical protein